MISVRYSPASINFLKKIKDKNLLNLFKDKIQEIRDNPYIGKPKKGDLAGIFGCDIYYNKTNYEIAYRIYVNDKEEYIVVIMAGTRENFYDNLKRYLK